jgi:hypothetical protein
MRVLPRLEGKTRIEARQKHTAFTPRERQKRFNSTRGRSADPTAANTHGRPNNLSSAACGNNAFALLTAVLNIRSKLLG